MEEKEIKCETCKLLHMLKDNGDYYASLRKNRSTTYFSICKVAVVEESYYETEDGPQYGGRTSYNPGPLNFCPECGRKIDESELTW